MVEPVCKKEESSILKCLVTFGERRSIVSTKRRELLQSIRDKFDLEDDEIYLQILSREWNEWVDVLPEDIPNNSKLKVVLDYDPQCGKNASPSKSSSDEVPAGSSSHVEPTDEVEGANQPDSPGSFSKILISNANHPLLTKLRRGEQLDQKENAEFVKKVFHLITEITLFPTPSKLALYVKILLREFPVLKGDDQRDSKKRWISLLQNKFAIFRKRIVKREQKPKVSVSTQTGLGNKPWQVWHPKYQKLPDNIPVFQDMSPIMLSIKQEYLKPEPDQEKIERFMCLTYQYRRAFIINMVPKVIAIQEMYPALFNCEEVLREFQRITGKESDKMFISNLENYGHIVYDLTKGSSAKCCLNLRTLAAKSKKVHYDWKNVCLLLLPYLFKENISFLWFENKIVCSEEEEFVFFEVSKKFDAQQNEPYIKCNGTMETVAEGSGFFQVYVENTLLAETSDFAIAMECFLASFFIFLIEYRSDLKNTLQLLQSFFYEYDDPSEEELRPGVIEVAEKLKDRMKQQA